MRNIYKRGVTLVGLGIVLVVMMVLGTVITVSAVDSINNAKKLTFALEISNIQEEVTNYYSKSNNEKYPIKNNITVSTSDLGTNISQFDGETVTDSKILLYQVDLDELGIEDTEYGNNTTDTDIYVLSQQTGRVYYLDGLKVGAKKYYTLTDDLIKIIASQNTNNGEDNVQTDANTPVITTTGFTVNSRTDNMGKDIYLTGINVTDTGNDIKVIKYELDKIDAGNAKEYFKSYGRELNTNDNTIKVNEGTNITIYAEDSSGNWSIKQEGMSIIPAGFYYVGGSTPTGIVISDNVADANKGTATNGNVTPDGLIGNQFVWVPVAYEATGTNDANGLDTGFTAVFQRVEWNKGISMSSCIEPYASGYTNENTEYYEMMRSVQKYNGFYIARYEAGDGDTTSERTGYTVGAHKVVSKKGAYVYNYVGWGNSMDNVSNDIVVNDTNKGKGAVYLSKKMYENSMSVVSTLCYGVQWDTTLQFISNEVDVYDSTSWGNYSNSTGAAINSDSSKMDYITGEYYNWKAKNIYDIAGNVFEWTMEAGSNGNFRVNRGGCYGADDFRSSAAYRASGYSYGCARRYWLPPYTLFRLV